MADTEFSVNYYALLGLDSALDAVTHAALIGKKIEQRQQEWKRSAADNSCDPAMQFDAKLGLTLVRRMTASLGETPPVLWREHALLRKKELASTAAQQAVAATEYFDLLGDVALDEETRLSIVKLVGDRQLVDRIVSMRKVTVAKDEASEFDEATYKRVMQIRQTLATILDRLGHETVYELISAQSGVAVNSMTPVLALNAALDRLKRNPGKMDSKNVANALYDAMAPLVQKDDASPGQVSAAKRLFDELQPFGKAAHLELFLAATFRKLQRIDVGQFDRLCALARKHTGLDEETVRRHFRALCKVWKIAQPLAVTELSERFQVCACCAALNRGDAKQCTSCQQNLFEQCLNCGSIYSAVARRCPSCGTDDASCAAARASLAMGRAHLEALEITDAQAHLDTARTATPRAKDVLALATSIDAARRQLAERLAQLDRLVVELKMHAARGVLAQLSRAMDAEEQRRRAAVIVGAIERAEALTARVHAEIARGDHDAAIELLGQALAQVADHVPALRAMALIPPPGPTRLAVRLGGWQVQLSWHSQAMTPAWRGHDFKVVRAAGHAPFDLADGEIVGETTAHAFVDAGCPVATPVHYAVFSVRALAHCAQPARAGPVLLLPPVSGVRTAQQERGLRFDWSPPERAQDTAIYKLGLADDLVSALARPPNGIARGEWTDSEVVEGRPMRYAFVARYAIEGRIVGAEPLVRDTMPAPAPTAVTHVHSPGGSRIAWRPAPLADETDELHVFDAASALMPPPDAILHGEDLPEPLQRVLAGAAVNGQPLPLFGEYMVVVIRRRGELVRCAKALRLRHLPAVDSLQLRQTERGVEARWTWPVDCSLATLRLSAGGIDLGTREVKRNAEEPQGACILEAPSPGLVAVAVTARSRDGRFSSDECEGEIHLRTKNTLNFKVGTEPARTSRGWFGGARASARGPVLRITLDHAEPLPAFEVRFSPELLPRQNEGRQLVVTQPSTEWVQAAEIDLTMLEGERGFVNLWLLDPAEAARITVVPLAPRF